MEIEILNVRLPSEIVKWLDSLVERGIYKSRSEAIREFCRQHVNSTPANSGAKR
jgi:Arc/MetJ-type ribon-helix-helix transcriptional regulator